LNLKTKTTKIRQDSYIIQITYLLLFHLQSGYFSNVSDIHSYHTRSSKNLRYSTTRTNIRMFAIKCI